MPYLAILVLGFAVLSGTVVAQDTLAQPKRPKVVQHRPESGLGCIEIQWQKVKKATGHEIRITKYGPGRLQYIEGTAYDQMRGWQDVSVLRYPYRFKGGKAGDWCGLAAGQMIRVWVRALDEHGVAGPRSKPRKFLVG